MREYGSHYSVHETKILGTWGFLQIRGLDSEKIHLCVWREKGVQVDLAEDHLKLVLSREDALQFAFLLLATCLPGNSFIEGDRFGDLEIANCQLEVIVGQKKGQSPSVEIVLPRYGFALDDLRERLELTLSSGYALEASRRIFNGLGAGLVRLLRARERELQIGRGVD